MSTDATSGYILVCSVVDVDLVQSFAAWQLPQSVGLQRCRGESFRSTLSAISEHTVVDQVESKLLGSMFTSRPSLEELLVKCHQLLCSKHSLFVFFLRLSHNLYLENRRRNEIFMVMDISGQYTYNSLLCGLFYCTTGLNNWKRKTRNCLYFCNNSFWDLMTSYARRFDLNMFNNLKSHKQFYPLSFFSHCLSFPVVFRFPLSFFSRSSSPSSPLQCKVTLGSLTKSGHFQYCVSQEELIYVQYCQKQEPSFAPPWLTVDTTQGSLLSNQTLAGVSLAVQYPDVAARKTHGHSMCNPGMVAVPILKSVH